MNGETFFVPKILLCGNEAEFISRVGDKRSFKIVGHMQFRGEKDRQKFNFVQDGKILLNDRLCESSELLNMIRGGGVLITLFSTTATRLLTFQRR